ncbi:hypothetical protein MPTA5024_19140 [Microbispora sp. ATCC PTA-5024]|nr:hypothetical protein MPTA5024_19140 [Microbispora sp. ATCC PTA-5024]
MAAAAVLMPLTVVSALIVSVAPASAADGEILSPGDGQTIRTPGPVAISAKTDWYQVSMALYVEGPSVSRQKIASGGANQTISGSFDPGDAPNGTFTVTLYGEITNKTYKTSTFVLSRPPQTPSGVEARLKNASTVVVTWAKGAEPDLRSYEISSRKTGASGSVSADEACSGSTCQASVAVPAKAAGQKVDLAVRAFRSDGQGGAIGSPGAATASVSIPAPKPSATTSQKPASEKPQASKTGDRRLPTTTLPNPLPTVPKEHGNTKLKLPAVNGTGDPAGPEVAPAKSDAPDVSAQSSFAPLGGLSYGIYAAIAVVLLLIGAHLGALVRRRSGSGAGPARPVATTGPIGPSPTAGTTTGASARTKPSATRRPTVILANSKPRAAGDTDAGIGSGTGTAAGDREARNGFPEPVDFPVGADDATAVTGPGGTGSGTAASGAGGVSTGSGQDIGSDDRDGSSSTKGGSTGKLDGPAPAHSTGSSGPRLPADILSDDAADPGARGRVPGSKSAAAPVPASAPTRGSDASALDAGTAEDGSASCTSVSASSTAPQPRLDDDLMPHRRPDGNDLPRPRLDDGLWDRPRQPQHDVWTEEDDDAVPSGTRDL